MNRSAPRSIPFRSRQPALILLAPLFLLLLLLTQPGALHAEALVDGKDYESINPPAPLMDRAPEVIEVFNFKCPHCFHLHPHLEAWAKTVEGKVHVKAMPVYWGQQTDIPVRAYYAALFMGKGKEMKDAIFKAQFEQGLNIENPDELAFIAEDLGLDPETFKENLNAFGVSAHVIQAKALQAKYNVKSTPTLVVNGRYRVSSKHTAVDHEKGNWQPLFDRTVELLKMSKSAATSK